MSSNEISPQYHRYVSSSQKLAAAQRYIILSGAIFVIAFCGTILLLRFISRDYHNKNFGTKDGYVSEEKSLTEHLKASQCQNVCQTKGCIKTVRGKQCASLVLEMLDPTVDPCEDFYKYACGGFNREPTEYSKKEMLLKGVADEITKFILDMIRKIPKSVPENTPGYSLTKLRKFYDSCVSYKTWEENAVPTALRYLEYSGIRNWPHLDDDYSFTDPDLDEIIVRLYLYNVIGLFYISPRNPSRNQSIDNPEENFVSDQDAITIEAGFEWTMTLHSEGVVSDSHLHRLDFFMEYFFPEDKIREVLSEFLSFDLALSEIQERSYQRHNGSESNFIDCAEDGFPHLEKWCNIVKKILDSTGFSQKHSKIILELEDHEYFRELSELFQNTSHRTIAHAFAIHFFWSHDLSMNFGLRRNALFSAAYLDPKYYFEINENRSPFCAIWVALKLPLLAGVAFYSAKYNNTDLRKKVNEMFLDIKEISLSSVINIPWIDPEAKEHLETLFSKMSLAAENYHQYIGDISAIDEFYKEVHITEESFLANNLECEKFRAVFHLRNMDNESIPEEFTKYPFAFRPLYWPSKFSIVFEFGVFVFPFMDTDRPRYANLGSVGAGLAHEFAHPIEIFLEREYQNKSETFANAYGQKRQCLEDHFSQYEIDLIGEKVRGKDTFSENLADHLGLRATLKSLRRYEENHGVEESLPGLHFTNEQMLFIFSAQLWCERNTLEGLKDYVGDSHSPAKVRILETYKNAGAFSEAFNCPIGSPMNPPNKCDFE